MTEQEALKLIHKAIELEKENKFEEAIKLLEKIDTDTPNVYEVARKFLVFIFFYQGVFLSEQQKLEDAKKSWELIKEDDDKVFYAQALFNLGLLLLQQGNYEKAKEKWERIKKEHDIESYANSQFALSALMMNDKDRPSGKYKDYLKEFFLVTSADEKLERILLLKIKQIIISADSFIQSKEHLVYATRRDLYLIKILDSIEKKDTKFQNKLFKILQNILNILNILKYLECQEKVAHYTTPYVANLLLENKSTFRLNTIQNVNDPTEGSVFNKYLNNIDIPSKNSDLLSNQVFISCFTFNHDKLNQFRLYGKDNNKEASGISLVFLKEFFSSENNFYEINMKSEQVFEEFLDKSDKNKQKKDNIKLPLYRCIYLDPETGFFSLAKRDEMTFYREKLSDKSNELENICEEAKKEWINYYKDIRKKEVKIKRFFIEIKEEMKNLINDNKNNEKALQEIQEILNLILLPLKYLVKHIAFQEEQECRMIYITRLSDRKIETNFENNWMYIEYDPPVRVHLDKIYLSVGAQKYEDYFRKLLNDFGEKRIVRISKNPFRN